MKRTRTCTDNVDDTNMCVDDDVVRVRAARTINIESDGARGVERLDEYRHEWRKRVPPSTAPQRF